MNFGSTLVAVLMLATLVALVTGVVLMSIGGKANAKYNHRLMVARVSLQGLVLLTLVLFFTVGK